MKALSFRASNPSTSIRRVSPRLAVLGVVASVALLAAASAPWWWSRVPWPPVDSAPNGTSASEPHDEHEHNHAGHDEATSIELSENALKNIGFQSLKVALGPYERSITLPAMVVERPGRSQIEVTAPMAGVVTRIVPVEGGAIEPGSEMFDLRLTHEELVVSQRDFLKTAESLDVVNKEIERLTAVGERIVAGKRILEQEYEKKKLEASLKAERQALLLHGLSEGQINAILESRELLQSLTVRAPEHVHGEEECKQTHLFHVQHLDVKPGQQIEAGEVLCVLADHCQLLIQARAFEDDANGLREAARQGREISAYLMSGSGPTGDVRGLKLLYVADSVDPETRAFNAYLQLPNEIALEKPAPDGQRFIEWRFKPGQRMEVSVPVETWQDQIVLPVESVVVEGAEAFVYRRNGDHFDRVAVHMEHQDPKSAVIANDGSLFPGDIVASTGAYQIHLALKNKAGGGVDPHAGHNH